MSAPCVGMKQRAAVLLASERPDYPLRRWRRDPIRGTPSRRPCWCPSDGRRSRGSSSAALGHPARGSCSPAPWWPGTCRDPTAYTRSSDGRVYAVGSRMGRPTEEMEGKILDRVTRRCRNYYHVIIRRHSGHRHGLREGVSGIGSRRHRTQRETFSEAFERPRGLSSRARGADIADRHQRVGDVRALAARVPLGQRDHEVVRGCPPGRCRAQPLPWPTARAATLVYTGMAIPTSRGRARAVAQRPAWFARVGVCAFEGDGGRSGVDRNAADNRHHDGGKSRRPATSPSVACARVPATSGSSSASG